MKKAITVLAALVLLFSFASCKDKPEKLTVYVSQFGEGVYHYGLLEGTPDEHDLKQKLEMKSMTAGQMYALLSTYGVSGDNIIVEPWQNPLSSYLAPIWIYDSEGNPSQAKEEYIEYHRDILSLDMLKFE